MGANLNTETKKVCAIISYASKSGRAHKIDKDMLNILSFDYYFILHDKDVKEDGEDKTKHYHLVINAYAKHRVSWYLNRITEVFNCSPEAVQIMVCDSVISSVQYLIHKNDAEKAQYDENNIVTNVSRVNLENIFKTELKSEEMTVARLKEIFEECDGSRIGIMERLGLRTYQMYHKAIDDFIKEYWPIYKATCLKYASIDALNN